MKDFFSFFYFPKKGLDKEKKILVNNLRIGWN